MTAFILDLQALCVSLEDKKMLLKACWFWAIVILREDSSEVMYLSYGCLHFGKCGRGSIECFPEMWNFKSHNLQQTDLLNHESCHSTYLEGKDLVTCTPELHAVLIHPLFLVPEIPSQDTFVF